MYPEASSHRGKVMFVKAIKIAQGLKAVEKSPKRLQGHKSEPMGVVASNQRDCKPLRDVMHSPRLCYKYGEGGHAPTDCQFREDVCRRDMRRKATLRVCVKGEEEKMPQLRSPW